MSSGAVVSGIFGMNLSNKVDIRVSSYFDFDEFSDLKQADMSLIRE